MESLESLRNRNIEDNKRILAAIGLDNALLKQKVQLKHTAVRRATKRKRIAEDSPSKEHRVEDLSNAGSEELCGRRRSLRIRGKKPTEDLQAEEKERLPDDDEVIRKVPKNRENLFGSVTGVEVGRSWATRLDCCFDGIHRPTVAGIHGSEIDGCYSIALSGGYEDDIDMGEAFTFTGEGGRDLKGTKANPKNLRTAPQSKDQALTRGNMALFRSQETGNPVRVIRGYKLHSQFAPEDGYRYDGLYKVEKAWFTTGLSGFGVWKFALKRIEDQAPPPWTYLQDCDSGIGSDGSSDTQSEASSDQVQDQESNDLN